MQIRIVTIDTGSEKSFATCAKRNGREGNTVQDDRTPRNETKRLKQLREEKMLTQAELAEKAGVSARTLWSVENGRPCQIATRRAILRALGVARRRGAKLFVESRSTDRSSRFENATGQAGCPQQPE